MSSRTVASAMERVATNVAIVSTMLDGVPHGATGNAWGEGTEPPMLLITFRRRGRTRDAVVRSKTFGVSVLGGDQEDMVSRFARPETEPGERFAGVDHRFVAGVPLLRRLHAWFVCDVRDVVPFGAYDIITGEVRASDRGEIAGPLIFHDGRLDQLRTEPEVRR